MPLVLLVLGTMGLSLPDVLWINNDVNYFHVLCFMAVSARLSTSLWTTHWRRRRSALYG